MAAKVVHFKREPFDVYIGRPSKWGNPYKVGRDGNREQVIALYRAYLLRQEHLLRSLPELKGKVLGCWCAPQACHGDILVELANREYREAGDERPVQADRGGGEEGTV